MKATDLFVRCLEAEGVTHLFGVPGEEEGRDQTAKHGEAPCVFGTAPARESSARADARAAPHAFLTNMGRPGSSSKMRGRHGRFRGVAV